MIRTLGLKKSDLLTDSLDAFWGRGAATQIVGPQVDSTPQDIFQPTETSYAEQPQSPQEAYRDYEQGEGTIKDIVERGVSETQDLTPDPRAGMGGISPMAMAPISAQRAPQRNPYDLGGFDAMIQKQLSYERGAFGITPQGGFGGQRPMSEADKFAKRQAEYKFNLMRREAAHQMQYKQGGMRAFAQEARAKQGISQQIIRNYREAANKQRMQAGLPVYESPWDVIAGGKRKVDKYGKVPQYDKEGNITGYKHEKVGQTLERYGGLAGAYQELKPVGRGAKSLTKKAASGISGFYKKGYEDLSKYNEKRKMNDLTNAINSEMDKYTDVPSNNKFVINKKYEKYEAPESTSFGKDNFSYIDTVQDSIGKGMAELNKESPYVKEKIVKDLRDV